MPRFRLFPSERLGSQGRLLVVVAATCSVLAIACSGTSPLGQDAARAADAQPDQSESDAAVCEPTLHLLAYAEPGCGANVPQRQCIGNNSCVMWACSCQGSVIAGCNGFSEPWSYKVGYAGSTAPTPGAACDPKAPPRDAGDGGTGGSGAQRGTSGGSGGNGAAGAGNGGAAGGKGAATGGAVAGYGAAGHGGGGGSHHCDGSEVIGAGGACSCNTGEYRVTTHLTHISTRPTTIRCQKLPDGCGGSPTCACIPESGYVNCASCGGSGNEISVSCDQI
jgi:hypothetical protein